MKSKYLMTIMACLFFASCSNKTNDINNQNKQQTINHDSIEVKFKIDSLTRKRDLLVIQRDSLKNVLDSLYAISNSPSFKRESQLLPISLFEARKYAELSMSKDQIQFIDVNPLSIHFTRDRVLFMSWSLIYRLNGEIYNYIIGREIDEDGLEVITKETQKLENSIYFKASIIDDIKIDSDKIIEIAKLEAIKKGLSKIAHVLFVTSDNSSTGASTWIILFSFNDKRPNYYRVIVRADNGTIISP